MNTYSSGENNRIISGAAGDIEAILTVPRHPCDRLMLICHPHPLYGGTMFNKVVYTVAKACTALGIINLRFNFRGVGNSQGYYTQGMGEAEDTRVLLTWLQTMYPGKTIALTGFSFGAYVAACISIDWKLDPLILIAPPIERFSFPNAVSDPCYVVQGQQDEIVDYKAVEHWINALQPCPHLLMIPEAGHFFHGKLIELQRILSDVLKH